MFLPDLGWDPDPPSAPNLAPVATATDNYPPPPIIPSTHDMLHVQERGIAAPPGLNVEWQHDWIFGQVDAHDFELQGTMDKGLEMAYGLDDGFPD